MSSSFSGPNIFCISSSVKRGTIGDGKIDELPIIDENDDLDVGSWSKEEVEATFILLSFREVIIFLLSL